MLGFAGESPSNIQIVWKYYAFPIRYIQNVLTITDIYILLFTGQRFALLEIKTTLTKLIQTFRVLPVPKFKPDLGAAAILKSYNGIMVQLEKRK